MKKIQILKIKKIKIKNKIALNAQFIGTYSRRLTFRERRYLSEYGKKEEEEEKHVVKIHSLDICFRVAHKDNRLNLFSAESNIKYKKKKKKKQETF